MNAVVCFPFRAGRPDHDRLLPIVQAHYAQSGRALFMADSPGDLFSISGARNAAALAAGDWDVVAFEDPDRVAPLENLQRGFVHAFATGRVTLAYDHYYSMSPAGHELGLDAVVPIGDNERERAWQEASYDQAALYCPGGLTIVPRAVWDRVGGFDERFIGWGYEDAAFLIAAGEFDRLSGPAYHFWHPDSSTEPTEPWPEYQARLAALQSQGTFTQRLIDEPREIANFGAWGAAR